MLLSALGVTALLGWAALGLRVHTSFDALLPASTPEVRDLHRVNREVGGIGYVVAMIDGATKHDVIAYADRFAAAAKKLPGVRYVEHHYDPTFFEKRALLLLTPKEIDELTQAAKRKLDKEKAKANPLIVNLLGDDEDSGPSLEELEKRYRAKVPVQDRLISADGKTAYVLLKPTGLSGDVAFSARLVRAVQALGAKLGAAVGEHGVAASAPAKVRLRLTGNYLVRYQDNQLMIAGLKLSSILALLLSVGLVTVWTRRSRVLLVIGLPLVCALLWTGGLARIALGEVNIITGFLAAILSGLGIDFGIHLFMRFMEERRAGVGVEGSLERAIMVTGRASFTGAATTAAAFLALALARFEGFSQFGEVAAAGVLLAYLANYVVGPPLYVLLERASPFVRAGSRSAAEGLTTRHPRLVAFGVAGAALAFTAFSIASITHVRFVTDFRKLQGQAPAVALQDQAVKDLGISTAPALAMTHDIAGAAAVARTARAMRKKEGKAGAIGRVLALVDLVPLDQERRVAALAKLRKVLEDPAVPSLPEKDQKQIHRAIEETKAKPFTVSQVPAYVRHRFLSPDGKAVLTLLSPIRPPYDTKLLLKWATDLLNIRKDVRAEGHKVWIADENLIAARIFRMIIDDGPRVMWGALIAVFVLLLVDLRGHPGRALLVLFPLLVGLVDIAGLMRLFSMSLNFLNAVMIPAIVGIGIDNAVHVYHRYRDEGPGSIGRIVRNTGSAAFLATATTAIGFGTLVVAHHAGLKTVGELALAGMASTFAATTIFFPSLLWIVEWIRHREKASP